MTQAVRPVDGDVVEAGCRVAGTIAARGRGDLAGARALLSSFESHEDLAAGALLVAELAMHALAEGDQRRLGDVTEVLTVRLQSLRD